MEYPVPPRLDTRTCPEGHTWSTVANDRSGCPHCARKRPAASLTRTHPDIAAGFSDINGYPVDWVGEHSGRYAWFRCPNGHPHLFSGIVNQVVGRGGTCTVCSGKQIAPGFNDLATVDPVAAAQWHPDNPVPADTVAPKSHTEYRWRCPDCGHEWTQSVAKRTRNHGCPVCDGRALVPGVTDLATTHPDIAATWDAGNDRSPQAVTAGSGYRASWSCPGCGHQWTATVTSRTHGSGCPVCAGQTVAPGINDLGTFRPELAAELAHPEQASIVTEHSSRVLTWRCDVPGHPPYEAAVYSRSSGAGCPACAGKTAVAGMTDLATLHPEVVSTWSTRNEVGPDQVTAHSGVPRWWTCGKDGHPDYLTSPQKRIAGHGCPVCSGKRALAGVNDLPTTHPALAAQWDDERDPTTVTAGSTYAAGWKCVEGHRWHAPVCSRTGRVANGCPRCAGHVSRGGDGVVGYLRQILPAGTEIRTSDRSVIGPRELDIVVPDLHLAIEFNGVFWHSEAVGKGRRYHADKYIACRRAGYRLLQIWEDDWADRRGVVESMIATVCGVRDTRRVGARTTTVVPVSGAQAAAFLTEHHLQGPAPGSRGLGLVDRDGALVAVMSVRSTTAGGVPVRRIERYATAFNVPGGFGKLLAVLRRELRQVGGGRIVTFSDNAVSDGDLYAAAGFTVTRELPPDYSYVVRDHRVHKFNYRISRFRRDPDLEYREGLTERELARINGLHRVWDSGKQQWTLEVS
jgi:transposase-like protein